MHRTDRYSQHSSIIWPFRIPMQPLNNSSIYWKRIYNKILQISEILYSPSFACWNRDYKDPGAANNPENPAPCKNGELSIGMYILLKQP